MDFFGIGAMELLLILVLALVVVGPRRLPEVARKLAKMLRDMRRMWTEVSTDFAKELNIEAASEDFRTIADTVGTLRQAGSPAKLLQDIVPKDVATTLEGRPPSPAELLAGTAPAARAKPAPSVANQTGSGEAATATPGKPIVQRPPAVADAQADSAEAVEAADQPVASAERVAAVSSAASADDAAPLAMPESEGSDGA